MAIPPPQRPSGPPRPPGAGPPRPPGMTPPRPPGIPVRPPAGPPRPAAVPSPAPGVHQRPLGAPAPSAAPAARTPQPAPAGRIPGVPVKAGGQFGADRYAPKLQKAAPKPKQKMLGNFLFRSVFFLSFALTAYVLGPNYNINGPAISFGLIGLMLMGVVLIDLVMWKCGNCGTYMGVLPWPGKRCKRCQVRFF